MMFSLSMDTQLNGLAEAAQGGIAAGTFAQLAGGTARVRLLRPVPLDSGLEVRSDDGGALTILHASTPVATVERTEPVRRRPPVVPTLEEAEYAARRHPLVDARHPFSDCIVCSPHRRDGLGVVFAPSLERPDVLIAPFHAADALVARGQVLPEALWGALDCVSFPADLLESATLAVTGELTARVERAVSADEKLVAVGWQVSHGARSHRTASAVLDSEGMLVAYADAVWVEVPPSALTRGGTSLGESLGVPR